MDDINNTSVIVDTAKQAVDISSRVILTGDVPLAIRVTDDGSQTVGVMDDLLAQIDKRAGAPRRLTGLARFAEVASFIAHARRFRTPESVVFADVDKVSLLAVYDYHEKAGSPRWGAHRAAYNCPLSREWQTWTGRSGKIMGQDEFADFIEENQLDIYSPAAAGGAIPVDAVSPADLLTLVRNLRILQKGEFSRSVNPTTGEMSLTNKVENDQSSTKIPAGFIVGIPVFEAGDRVAVGARIRFAMSNGKPTFAFSLIDPEHVKRSEFGAIRTRVAEKTGLPVLAGAPES